MKKIAIALLCTAGWLLAAGQIDGQTLNQLNQLAQEQENGIKNPESLFNEAYNMGAEPLIDESSQHFQQQESTPQHQEPA